jgi:lysophospholipase L1-like esterase
VIRSFAALGDSFTAGTGSPPEARWADRLARSLGQDGGELLYRNLASEGATSAKVLGQVAPALQIEPDLVTVICGANDVLLSARPDLDAFSVRLAAIFDQFLTAMPDPLLLTATVPERWVFLGLGPRTARRVEEGIRRLNEQIREIAGRHAVPCLEVVGHPGLDDPENFNPDGLHPSPLGHARAAREFERLLAAHLPRRALPGRS